MIDLDFAPADDILMNRRALRRELAAQSGLRPLRIAILGGTTTDQVVQILELLLLNAGFEPTFHQSEYGRFYEDAVYDHAQLAAWKPDLIYIHTSCVNVTNKPALSTTEEELPGRVEAEMHRWREIWDSLEANVGCQVIQNNFELPPYAILGNMDAVAAGGYTRFLALLNVAFAEEAARRPKLLLQDVHRISAEVGLRRWFDWDRYFSYKVLITPEANLELCRSLASLVKAVYGKSKKVLVLDLDNTLWGGVIGDDGADKILIGRETPQAEAYTAFQEYALSLRDRGILLAVASKNTDTIALEGFQHPDTVLKLEHFSAFKANWNPKHENIADMAHELALGVDSFVFADDNPAERAIVAGQIPGIAVPEIGNQVTQYASILQRGRFFEPAGFSKEDLARNAAYAGNAQRNAQQAKYANYGEYLDSLEMTAEIDAFRPVYLERIAQLTNKTNQFNLTTRRYTLAEMEAIAKSAEHLALYGKLTDKFGDNGLIAIVVGHKAADTLELDLWLMSCRVLKRDMEFAMLDAVAARAQAMGVTRLRGTYKPTAKNGMVADLYEKLGFTLEAKTEAGTTWLLELRDGYTQKNHHIKVTEYTHA
jgi:FkbH-like protein